MTRLRTGLTLGLAVLALAACAKKDSAETAATASTAAAPATAQTAAPAVAGGPAIKAGLWEMATKVEGMPQAIVTKMCLDAGLAGNFASRMGPMQQGDTQCENTQVKQTGNVIDMTAVCSDGGQKINTRVRMEMQGDTGFRQSINATFDPPQQGRDKVSTSVDGKWLGACSADQKPGDVIMPGGLKVNMYDAMKGN